jgi:hypothetical protein
MVKSQTFVVNFDVFSVGAAQVFVFGFSHRAQSVRSIVWKEHAASILMPTELG